MTLRCWNSEHVWCTHEMDSSKVENIVLGPHAPVFDKVQACTPWRCFTLYWSDGSNLSIEAKNVDALPVHIMHVMSCMAGTPGSLVEPYCTELRREIHHQILQLMEAPPPNVNYRRWAADLKAPPTIVLENPDGRLALAVKNRDQHQHVY